MPVSTFIHKGREILYVDFSNLKKKEPVMETLNDWVKAYQDSTKEIYLLLDVREAFNDPEVIAEAAKMSSIWEDKGIASVPTLVVNGKYRLIMPSVRSLQELNALVNFLLNKS